MSLLPISVGEQKAHAERTDRAFDVLPPGTSRGEEVRDHQVSATRSLPKSDSIVATRKKSSLVTRTDRPKNLCVDHD